MEKQGAITYAIKPNKKATIFGIDPDVNGDIYVPDLITCNEIKYPVDLVGFGCSRRMDYNRAERVFIPSSVKNIYFDNPYIREVHILGNVSEFKMHCRNCEGLEIIEVHGSVKQFKYKALENCKNLRRIIISKGSNPEIGCLAFINCSNLRSITIEGKPIKLEHIPNKCCFSAFCGCVNFHAFGEDYKIQDGMLLSLDGKILYTILGREQESGIYVVPNTVKDMLHCLSYDELHVIDFSQCQVVRIEDEAFRDCTTLEKVILPFHELEIGDRTFCNCSNLKVVENFSNIKKFGVASFAHTGISTCYISSKVTEIPHSAFSECDNLIYINIPLEVKLIVNSAFKGCFHIKNIAISRGFEKSIKDIFGDSNDAIISYHQSNMSPIMKRTGAYTHGNLSCPYCGSKNVSTYADGTAECNNCGGEYMYWNI